MKVKCEKSNIGITVNIYMSNAELKVKNILSEVYESGKDYRVKRSFDINFSPKALEASEIVLCEMLDNLQDDLVLFEAMGMDGLIEDLERRLKHKLNDYQFKKIRNIIEDIAIPILLNKSTQKDIVGIKDMYNLTDKDILISFIGNFGYGKTTTIKKLLGFGDEYKFLLVDNGRTTIFNTIVKSLIVNNNEIEYFSEDGSWAKKSVEEYGFKNRIMLCTEEYIYQNVIATSLNNAFEQYKKDSEDILTIMREFIKNTRCALDGLFGEVSRNSIENGLSGFYKIILDEFRTYSEEDDVDFYSHEIFQMQFHSFFENKVKSIIERLKQELPEVMIKLDRDDSKNYMICFELKVDQISKSIDKIYRYFTDNSLKGDSLRICVKELYVETDFDVSQFKNNADDYIEPPECLFNANELKYKSFVYVDTVGCGHTQEKQMEIENNMDLDVLNNRSILSESDVIILLDKATETMQLGVKNQLYTLNAEGLKNKVLLCYSHYNQFIKSDMQTDADREEQLDMYLSGALDSLYPPQNSEGRSQKAKQYYAYLNETLEDGFLQYLKEKQRKKHIVYLKGLVARKSTAFENRNSRRQKSALPEDCRRSDDEKAKELNAGIEFSEECLVELIDKIVLLYEEVKEKKSHTYSIITHHKEDKFKMNYSTNVYHSVPNKYKRKQENIYLINTPAYNTTKALCQNAVYGTPIHYGTSNILRPVVDYEAILQAQISEFIDLDDNNFLELELEENISDKDLSMDFLKDQIKQSVGKQFSQYLMQVIVKAKRNTWQTLANDGGSGVKHRRAQGIYQLLESIASMQKVNLDFLGIFTSCIDEVIDNYNVER